MHQCKNNSNANVYHLEQMVDNFFPYSQKQLQFDKPVTIVFHSDEQNANTMLGKTAFYDPKNYEVYLFVDKRHPKDILRSLSHELVHHAQNCRGDFGGCDATGWEPGSINGNAACVKDTDAGYAQRDPHMRKMEQEAYTKGNLIFRDFEDLIKTGKINIEIDFSDSGEPKMSLKEWKNDELNMLLMKKWGLLKESTEEEDPKSKADELLRLGGYDKTGKKMGKGTKTPRAGARLQTSREDSVGGKIEDLEEEQAVFAPNHYCVHHGGVQHEGKIQTAEAVSHNYDKELGRVTHYDMKLKDGTLLEAVAAEDIQVTNASLAEEHAHRVEDKDDVKEEAMGRGPHYKGIDTKASGDERGNRPSAARKMSLKKESEKADTKKKQQAVTHKTRPVRVSGKQQKEETHPSLPPVRKGKISVREARELTRRILERIRKENN